MLTFGGWPAAGAEKRLRVGIYPIFLIIMKFAKKAILASALVMGAVAANPTQSQAAIFSKNIECNPETGGAGPVVRIFGVKVWSGSEVPNSAFCQ